MKKYKAVSEIISTLTRAEKVHFKILNQLAVKERRKYILLYDYLDYNKSFDAVLFLKKHSDFGKDQLPKIFNYLQELLLDSLVIFHSNKSVKQKIKHKISAIEIMMSKSLFKQAAVVTKQAIKLAYSIESYIDLIKLSDFYQTLPTIGVKDKAKFLNKILIKRDGYLLALTNESDYQKLRHQINVVVGKIGYPRSNKETQKYNKIIRHRLLNDIDEAHTTLAKLMFHYIWATYYVYVDSYNLNNHQHNKALVSIFENASVNFRKQHINAYISALNNLAYICALYKLEETKIVISKLNNIPIEYPQEMTQRTTESIYFSQLGTHLYYFNQIGEFEKSINLINLNINKLSQYNFKKNYYSRGLTISMAISFFAVSKYDDAIRWMSLILDNELLDPRTDQYLVMKILNLVIHFELGNDILLLNTIQSTYQFFSRKNKLFTFEKVMLQFLKNYNRQKEIEQFKELLPALIEINKDPYDRRVFETFNFFAWVKSRVNGTPFAEEIKRTKFN